MLRTIKKVLLGSLTILGVNLILYITLLLNPSVMYSHSTELGKVTVYHNQAIEDQTEEVLQDVMKLISTSDIYDDGFEISLCLNEESNYSQLHPFAGDYASAYAFLDITAMHHCMASFTENTATMSWDINEYELRKLDLTYLIAHEFMHNYQYNFNPKYQIKSTLGKINWKLEGHAEYISRGFKNDGKLLHKIKILQKEEQMKQSGIPVFTLADGTIQNLSYYKYALITQYLMEEQKMSFAQICKSEEELEQRFEEMLDWSSRMKEH